MINHSSTTRYPGWFEHVPKLTRAMMAAADLRGEYPDTSKFNLQKVEVSLEPHDKRHIVLSKLGQCATPDQPFWLSPEFNRYGQVAYIPPSMHGLNIAPEGYYAPEAYIYNPTNGTLTQAPLGPIKVAMDVVADQNLNLALQNYGVPTLLHHDYLHNTTKDKTTQIAEECDVRTPVTFGAHTNPCIEQVIEFFDERDITEVVVKPYNDTQGRGVRIVELDELEDALYYSDAERPQYIVIEERIIPDRLVVHGIQHDWNIRAVVVEGRPIDWYVRASSTPGPVNICLGAFLLTRKDMQDFMPSSYIKQVDKKVTEDSQKIGQKFNKGILGLDFIIRDGIPYLIEVNSGMVVCGSFPDYSRKPDSMTRRDRKKFAKKITRAYGSTATRYAVSDAEGLRFDNQPTYFDLCAAIADIGYALEIDSTVAISNYLDMLSYVERRGLDFFGSNVVMQRLSILTDLLVGQNILDPEDEAVNKLKNLQSLTRERPSESTPTACALSQNPNELWLEASDTENPLLGICMLIRAIRLQPAHINAVHDLMTSLNKYCETTHGDLNGRPNEQCRTTLIDILDLVSVIGLPTSEGEEPDHHEYNTNRISNLLHMRSLFPNVFRDLSQTVLNNVDNCSLKEGEAPISPELHEVASFFYLWEGEAILALLHWLHSFESNRAYSSFDNVMAKKLGVGKEHLPVIATIAKPTKLDWQTVNSTLQNAGIPDAEIKATTVCMIKNEGITGIPQSALALIDSDSPLQIYIDVAQGDL